MSDATTNLIEGRTGKWEIVIGLEVHAQVISEGQAVLRRRHRVRRRAEHARSAWSMPAMPGMLPVINRVLRRAGGAHRARPQRADQPAARCSTARTTSIPICRPAIRSRSTSSRSSARARSTLDLADGATRDDRHHAPASGAGRRQEPARPAPDQDLRRSQPRRRRADGDRVASPTCARRRRPAAYLRKLRSILRYLGTCDGNMEEGSMRCDVNVSVRKPGEPLGTRCEIKNVNSIRFVHAGDRVRGAPPDRGHRGRRHDRAGDAAVRSATRARRARCAPRRRARLPLFPRSRPAAAGAGRRTGSSEIKRDAARAAGREEARASCADYGLSRLRRRRAGRPSRRPPTSSRRSPRAAMPSSPPTG